MYNGFMVSENWARPLSSIATKSFTHLQYKYDPRKASLQQIMKENWSSFLNQPEVKRKGVRDVVLKEVEKMITCGTLDAGYEIYECPNCHRSHIICYTCKSRFCPSCGVQYA